LVGRGTVLAVDAFGGQSGCPAWQMMTALPPARFGSRNLSEPAAMMKLCR
jgi:hypothetical protein